MVLDSQGPTSTPTLQSIFMHVRELSFVEWDDVVRIRHALFNKHNAALANRLVNQKYLDCAARIDWRDSNAALSNGLPNGQPINHLGCVVLNDEPGLRRSMRPTVICACSERAGHASQNQTTDSASNKQPPLSAIHFTHRPLDTSALLSERGFLNTFILPLCTARSTLSMMDDSDERRLS